MLEAQEQLTKLTEQLDATSKNKQDLDGRLRKLDDRVSHYCITFIVINRLTFNFDKKMFVKLSMELLFYVTKICWK